MLHYTLNPSQELTEDQKKQRYDFCKWIIDEQIDPNKIFFTDEKWFCVSGPSKQQSICIWPNSNPFAYEETYCQARDKILCWTGIVNGKFLPIFWFQKEDGSTASVNRKSYLRLKKEVSWPKVSSEPEVEEYFYTQNGAQPHCTNAALEFFEDRFPNHVISRRSQRCWPARSPDLNPLDFFLSGVIWVVNLRERIQQPFKMRR